MPSFCVTIPGQPPTWNHAYIRRRGGRMAKAPGVEAYQVGITLLVRTTKPSGPPPAGQIRVRYWLRLKHDIDADNTMKIINDALAVGLGVDDRVFLPCVHEKSTGHLRPEVAVEIEW